MTKITMDGQYQTRDGRKVRVLCVDRNNGIEPVVALVAHGNGIEDAMTYTAEGRFYQNGSSVNDLIPIPKKIRVKFCVNVHKSGDVGSTYDTKDDANENAGPSRFALIEIDREVTEGEGL